MSTMTIRHLDDRLIRQLRLQAARNGRSMEEEVRTILKTALATTGDTGQSLYQSIRARLQSLGGVELDIPTRDPIRPVDLG